jgi:hypothetical protein
MDAEKGVVVQETALPPPSADHSNAGQSKQSVFKRWNNRIENLAGFEARGLARVPSDEREIPPGGYLQMFMLWFSANTVILVVAVGLTGPLVFGLGFLDSSMCAVFGTMLGAASAAYMGTWGPASGNRTMVSALIIGRAKTC